MNMMRMGLVIGLVGLIGLQHGSLGKDKDSIQSGKPCPQCTTAMVATRVIKSAGMPGGMYWVCPKDDYRMKT